MKYNPPKSKRTSEDIEQALQDIYKLENVFGRKSWNDVFQELIKCYHIVHGYHIKKSKYETS